MTDAPDLGTESVRCFPFFAINSTAHVEFPLSRLLPDGVSLGRRQAPHPDGTVHPVPAAPFRDQVFMRHVQAASARVRGTHFPAGETAVPGGGVLTGSEWPRGPRATQRGSGLPPSAQDPLGPRCPGFGSVGHSDASPSPGPPPGSPGRQGPRRAHSHRHRGGVSCPLGAVGSLRSPGRRGALHRTPAFWTPLGGAAPHATRGHINTGPPSSCRPLLPTPGRGSPRGAMGLSGGPGSARRSAAGLHPCPPKAFIGGCGLGRVDREGAKWPLWPTICCRKPTVPNQLV